MSDNPLGRIPSFDRVSIRAVLVRDGEDPTQALAAAGIVDPVALPVVLGEGAPDVSFGDGFTPNLTAVLELDAPDDDLASAKPIPSASGLGVPANQARSGRNGTPTPRSAATNLPTAYGLQPLAPVDKPSRRRPRARRPAAPPPTPSLDATQQQDHSVSARSQDDRE
jgi:hypothetical protein